MIPVGATEQHGPHLPLSTDTTIGAGLAERLAARRTDVVVAPALAYGSSGEHQAFTGTLSVGQEAIELFLVELCRSATLSFGRVLLLCSHGGNRAPVGRAVERLAAEGRDVRAVFPDWRLDAHAGRAETSLMLALAPGAVRAERAEPGATAPVASLMDALVLGGVRAVSENGVLGDPSGANSGEGHGLLDRMCDELGVLLDAWDAS